jgi:hypothetical protein
LHADFFVEHACFGLRETCHNGAVEDVVIMIVLKIFMKTKELIKKVPVTIYESMAH